MLGTVSYNDGAGDTGSQEPTYFAQFSATYTPSSGSAISFYTYCIDLYHNISVGQTLSVYVSGNESTAFLNGSRMVYIYEMYGTQNLNSNPDQAAAVQLALWDLTLNNHNPTTFGLDADGSYSSGDESVYSITFNSGEDASTIAGLVNQYLQASIGATMQGGWLNADANGTGQTRGQSMPIPELLNSFGETQPVTIGGTVYLDTNGSGVLNAGESGISGVTMTLSGTNGLGQSITATTTTASNGSYSFSTDSNGKSLYPGTYQIAETEPSGYVSTANTVGTVNGTTDGVLVPTDKIGSIVLTSGQSGINYNFGDTQPVTIGGTVYQDTNGNGVLDTGEPGISGVTVTLSGTNGLGVSITATTTTAANGTYSFTKDSGGNLLLPGTYQVAETEPTGYQQGSNTVGTVNGTTDGTLVPTDKIGSILLTSGQNGINYNFGEVKPIAISGTVYQDTNSNGVKDTGEPGLAGVTLTLSGTSEGVSVSVTTTTGSNGTYSFTTNSSGSLLSPGTYQVTVTPPVGYLQGSDTVGTINGTTVGTAISTTAIGSILVPSGQAGINYNFGELLTVTILGNVYEDANGNGVLDTGESGISGVTLTLTGTTTGGQAITVTTTTAANGTYDFNSTSAGTVLPSGTYQVAETQPAGYQQGLNTVGTVNGTTDGTLIPTDKIGSIAMTIGQVGINYNFGEVKPVTISGTVYTDANEDGLLESGDSGISGVTLTLSGTSLGVAVSATTTTSANGTYSFSKDSTGKVLLPGTYQITETTPSGYIAVSANVGTVNGTLDGTKASASSLTSIALISGQSGINYNFGLNIPAAVSGYVYLDFDRNQVKDSTDGAFASETLTLTGTNTLGQSVSVTTTTDANGYYIFAGLLSGTYNIVITAPGGVYSPDAANIGTVNGTSVGRGQYRHEPGD